jgi:hypothetical protein
MSTKNPTENKGDADSEPDSLTDHACNVAVRRREDLRVKRPRVHQLPLRADLCNGCFPETDSIDAVECDVAYLSGSSAHLIHRVPDKQSSLEDYNDE